MPDNLPTTPVARTLALIAAIAVAPCAMAAGVNGASAGPAVIAAVSLAGVLLVVLLARYAGAALTRRIARKIGRRQIYRTLRRYSTDVLDNFILPGPYDGLTCIHYAALTEAGIVCVQAKHCRGTVTGGADHPQWHDDRRGARQQFLNPLIQNAGHVKALSRIVPDVPIINLVVFTGPMRFSAGTERNVVHVESLGRHLDGMLANARRTPDMNDAWRTLRASVLTDTASRKDLDAQLSFG